MLGSLVFMLVVQPVQAGGPIELRFAPQLGDKVQYELTQTFVDEDDGTKQVLVDRVEIKVVQRDSLGIFGVDYSILPVSESMDGVTIPLGKGLTPYVLRERKKGNGALDSRDEAAIDPTTAFRYARLQTLVFPKEPVKVGDSWTVRVKSEPGSELPSFETQYKLVSLETAHKPTDAKITVVFREEGGLLPMSATGDAVVDIATGLTRKLTLRVENATIPGGEGAIQTLDLALVAKRFETKPQKPTKQAGKATSGG